MNLKNRVVFAPTTTCFATPEGEVTERLIEYYLKRARGGTALIIVEPGVVHPGGKLFERSMGIYRDETIAPLAHLTGGIREQGARALIQLCHSGPKGRAKTVGGMAVSPSGQPFYQGEPTHKLTVAEIGHIIEDFVFAARRAAAAGFDGVEIHAAHMYLLSSFLSPLVNTRNDEYGRDNRGRAKIVVDIIKKIKGEMGERLLVGVRYNGKEIPGGLDVVDAVELAQIFKEAGADLLHISAYEVAVPSKKGFVAVPATSVAGDDRPYGCFLDYAAAIKEAVSVPVIAVGKLNDPDAAENALTSGRCDLIALGRALIADPAWTEKIRKGIEPAACLCCNSCLDSLPDGEMTCAVNDEL